MDFVLVVYHDIQSLSMMIYHQQILKHHEDISCNSINTNKDKISTYVILTSAKLSNFTTVSLIIDIPR